jgi:hypothetical protein
LPKIACFKVYLHNQTDCVVRRIRHTTKRRIDPIFCAVPYDNFMLWDIVSLISVALCKHLFKVLLWNGWTQWNEVTDSKSVSQMNVLRCFGHTYVYILWLQHNHQHWWNNKKQRMSKAWQNTHVNNMVK